MSVFLPILKETLNRMFRKNGCFLKGKDYTELKEMVELEFGLKMPIPVIASLMKEISRTCSGNFILNKDHSFIIRSEIVTDVGTNYEIQKNRIHNLENNFRIHCEGLGIEPKFDDLLVFKQFFFC